MQHSTREPRTPASGACQLPSVRDTSLSLSLSAAGRLGGSRQARVHAPDPFSSSSCGASLSRPLGLPCEVFSCPCACHSREFQAGIPGWRTAMTFRFSTGVANLSGRFRAQRIRKFEACRCPMVAPGQNGSAMASAPCCCWMGNSDTSLPSGACVQGASGLQPRPGFPWRSYMLHRANKTCRQRLLRPSVAPARTAAELNSGAGPCCTPSAPGSTQPKPRPTTNISAGQLPTPAPTSSYKVSGPVGPPPCATWHVWLW